MGFGRVSAFVGLILLGWVALAIVIAALTTWWVLFALFALFPLAMMSSMAMMGTTARSAGDGPKGGLWAWCTRWCATWFAPIDREVRQPVHKEHEQQPNPQH